MNTSATKNFKASIFHSKSDILINHNDLEISKQKKLKSIDLQSVKKIFESLRFKVKDFSRIGDSTYHLIFEVKTDKGDLILKVHALDDLFDEESFHLEEKAQLILKSKSLPSVKVLKIDLSKADVDFQYLVMEKARGKNLGDLYRANKLPGKVYEDLGRIFKQIHTTRTLGFGHFDTEKLLNIGGLVGTEDNWGKFVLKNLDKHISDCLSLKIITKSEGEKISKLLSENKDLFELEHPSLLHNDPGFRNIFAKGNKISAVLDWEDSISGDPDFELAFISSFFFGSNDSFRSFLKGYGKDPNELEKNKKYLLYFLRIVLMKEISRSIQGKPVDGKRINFALDKLSQV